HASELADRPQIVVGNKIDAPEAEANAERVAAWCAEHERQYFAVSAVTGEGIGPLIRAVAEQVHELRLQAERDEVEFEAEYTHVPEQDREIRVARALDGGWDVTGVGVERAIIKTDMTNEEAVAYLQRRLQR